MKKRKRVDFRTLWNRIICQEALEWLWKKRKQRYSERSFNFKRKSSHAIGTMQVTIPRQPSHCSSNPFEPCTLSTLWAVLGLHETTPTLIIDPDRMYWNHLARWIYFEMVPIQIHQTGLRVEATNPILHFIYTSNCTWISITFASVEGPFVCNVPLDFASILFKKNYHETKETQWDTCPTIWSFILTATV